MGASLGMECCCSNRADEDVTVVHDRMRMRIKQAREQAREERRSRRQKAEEAALDLSLTPKATLSGSERSSVFRHACMSMMVWSLSSEELAHLQKAFLALEANSNFVDDKLRWALTEQVIAEKAEGGMGADVVFEKEGQQEAMHPAVFEELLATMAYTKVRIRGSLLNWTFRCFDTENRGFLTVQNIRAILGDRLDCADVQELASEVDTDQDGLISFEEFAAFLQRPPVGEEESQPQQRLAALGMPKNSAAPTLLAATPVAVGKCEACKKKVTPGVRFCTLLCREEFLEKEAHQALVAKQRAEAERKAQEKKAKCEAELKAKKEANQLAKERKAKAEANRKALEGAKCMMCQKQLASTGVQFCSLDCKESFEGLPCLRAWP
jgi:Ca2+-binding EF-hand superfamily protein